MPEECHNPVDPLTRASHPGGLEVEDAIYDQCFPGRPLAREHFRSGCINPALVVADELLAVYTDLGHSGRKFPTIRIVSQPLSRMSWGPAELGQRLVTISVYYAGWLDPYRWAEFEPIAVNCLTSQKAEISRLTSSLDQEEWECLETYLAKVPKPYRPDTQFCFVDDQSVVLTGAVLAQTRPGLWARLRGISQFRLLEDGVEHGAGATSWDDILYYEIDGAPAPLSQLRCTLSTRGRKKIEVPSEMNKPVVDHLTNKLAPTIVQLVRRFQWLVLGSLSLGSQGVQAGARLIPWRCINSARAHDGQLILNIEGEESLMAGVRSVYAAAVAIEDLRSHYGH